MMMSKLSTITGITMKTRVLALGASLFLILALVLMSLAYATYDKGYFRDYQRLHRIDIQAGLDQDKLDLVTSDLLDYLKEGDNKLLEPHFNDREILHMEDVFDLYEGGRTLIGVFLGLFALVYLIGLRTDKAGFISFMPRALVLSLGLFALVGLVLVGNFSENFVKFHLMFFDNDLWILNPETDLMIRMLPEHIFESIVMRVGKISIIGLLLMEVIFLLIKRKVGKHGTTGR